MSVNCRFVLDEKRYVIDTVNVANSGKGYCRIGAPEDDKHLRERVLSTRVHGKLPWDEKHAVLSIWHAVLCAIRASHLNTFDPTMSIQHKFDGKLGRRKNGTQHFTSLSLFCDDLETALRDLYGDVDREAVDRVVDAVHVIIYGFSKYVGPDLWKEQRDAERFDLILGIGNDGCGINSSEHARGMVAKLDLIVRACKVKASPSDFSAYTVEFAKRFGEHWQLPSNPMEFLGLSDEMKRCWLIGPL